MLVVAGFDAQGYRCAGEFLIAHRDECAGCVLLDISMPGPSGIDLMNALRPRALAPPVIFITGRDDVGTTVHVMKSGALDYLVKPVTAERVLPAVRRALAIDAERRAAHLEHREVQVRFETLTAAERTIFDGVVHDRLNKQLAADLGMCERTIKARRARMLEKLQVRTVPQLVRVAKILGVTFHPRAPRHASRYQ
jgi:FixJ family two-component response regulator